MTGRGRRTGAAEHCCGSRFNGWDMSARGAVRISRGEERGLRPRPRAALIGEWEDEEKVTLTNLFPTMWTGQTVDQVLSQVDPAEIDIAISTVNFDRFAEVCHLISFAASARRSAWAAPWYASRHPKSGIP